MASETIKLYVDLNALGGTAAAGAQLMITPDVQTDSEGLINPKSAIYTMDADGLAEIDLNVNPMYPVKYMFVVFGDNEKPKQFGRYVSAGADVTLKELFEAGVILPPGDLIYAYVLGQINAVKQLRGTNSVFGLTRPDGETLISVNGVWSVVGGGGSDTRIVNKIAASALSGHRIVKTTNETDVDYASNTVSADRELILGITTAAAPIGEPVPVKTFGEITEPSWNWAAGGLVFCGASGVLTQTPPTSGFICAIGTATSATSIWIRIRQAINLI